MTNAFTEDKLVEQPSIPSFAELEIILAEMAQIITPPPEKTIFSVGSRGYYENPTSDVLAFFMNPVAEHGFGMLFLKSFLECMNKDKDGRPSLDGIISEDVSIQREATTEEYKRIDFLIITSDWCLVIENKIYHEQVNPFESYEECARKNNPNAYFAILSPNGKSVNKPLWQGVSYKKYLSVVRKKLGKHSVDAPLSKWNVLAREFIVHIENELYRPLMNEKQIAFVEKHAEQIEQFKKLQSDYRVYLQQILRKLLKKAFPCQSFSTKDERWAIRCKSTLWGSCNLAFLRKGQCFFIRVYLIGLSAKQVSQAQSLFAELEYWNEAKGAWHCWKQKTEMQSKDEAFKELERLAKCVNEVLAVNKS